jgi:hypothetical protein
MRWDRLISGIVAATYVVIGWYEGLKPYDFFKMISFLLLSLTCIWFSDEMASVRGIVHGRRLRTSPGCLMAVVGWLLLLAPVIAAFLVYVVWDRLMGKN